VTSSVPTDAGDAATSSSPIVHVQALATASAESSMPHAPSPPSPHVRPPSPGTPLRVAATTAAQPATPQRGNGAEPPPTDVISGAGAHPSVSGLASRTSTPQSITVAVAGDDPHGPALAALAAAHREALSLLAAVTAEAAAGADMVAQLGTRLTIAESELTASRETADSMRQQLEAARAIAVSLAAERDAALAETAAARLAAIEDADTIARLSGAVEALMRGGPADTAGGEGGSVVTTGLEGDGM